MKFHVRDHKSGQNFRKKNHMNYESSDNYTRIVHISSQSYFAVDNAVMIAAFPGPGMIGSIVCTQLIEQLGMHQIAYIHSKYIMPGVLWVGGKLRHPFRIYCNRDRSVFLVICDVPVIASAIDSISTAITGWCKENNVNKLLVVSGIYPENIQPFPKDFVKRTTFVIENDGNLENNTHNNGKGNRNQDPLFAFIGGLPGQILANCVVRFIHCLAILVPTLSFAPDPEGAALAIETLGNLIPNAKVSNSQLKHEAEIIKKQLSELAKLQYRLLKNNRTEDVRSDDAEQIYK